MVGRLLDESAKASVGDRSLDDIAKCRIGHEGGRRWRLFFMALTRPEGGVRRLRVRSV